MVLALWSTEGVWGLASLEPVEIEAERELNPGVEGESAVVRKGSVGTGGGDAAPER